MRYFEITDTITGSINYLTESSAINKLGLVSFDLAYSGLVQGILILEVDQPTYDFHKPKTLKEFTMADQFKKLVVRYAGGRKLCNCGEAYEPCEQVGCSSSRISAKEYIAKRVLEDLN